MRSFGLMLRFTRANGREKLLNAFCRKVLRLHRDEDTVGGSQCVDGQHA